ncbi:hypothetical protein EZV73_16555 [Acidaminobacter sp. JC074]|uniref:ABC transporter substrate-binding protein n=1 Tax=Acidaminobacter sp. JC074 TaxID=2530199 RepID=UPI001F1027E4|nr:ABC transporter substrate-binding protein [Acidaminobacter sp. JC074]MCH4889209.1 hypothetical protein [Acidaminobacter sp. JC074]
MKKYVLIIGLSLVIFLMGCQEEFQDQVFVDDTGEEAISGEQVASLIEEMPGIERGNYLTLGAYQVDERMNPLLNDSSSSMDPRRFLFNGLITLDYGKVVDDLASVEVSEDQKTFTFRLHDVKFHNGDQVTADDVIFTYKVLANKDYKGPYIAVVSDMVGLKAYQAGDEHALGLKKIDEKTVVMTFDSVGSERIVDFTLPILSSRHYAYDNFIEFEMMLSDPVGTGPFMLEDYVEHQHIRLKRFDDYYGDKPYIDGVVIHKMPYDTSDLIITQGAVDFTYLPINVDTDDMLMGQDLVEYMKLPNISYDYMALNQSNEIFNDVRVRKALAYAIDLDAFVDTQTDGFGQRVHTSVWPESSAYPEDLNTYEKDVEHAKELLKEAGWQDSNGDGVLDKDGRDFIVEWLYLNNPSDISNRQAIEGAIEELKEVGILVNLKSDFHSAIVKRVYFDNDYDICSFYTSFDMYENPRAKFGIDSSSNATQYYNEEAENIFDQLDQTDNLDERDALMKEWGMIANDTLPFIFLSRSSIFVVNNPRVYNYSSTENILKEISHIKLKHLK